VVDLLQSLQRWYTEQCDGDWEHTYGIAIETLDNPGWLVKVDLTDTTLNARPFPGIDENVDEHGWQQGGRWLRCYVENGVWHGAGDETKLATILQTFLFWAAGDPTQPQADTTPPTSDPSNQV
jgi:hypothetical protein